MVTSFRLALYGLIALTFVNVFLTIPAYSESKSAVTITATVVVTAKDSINCDQEGLDDNQTSLQVVPISHFLPSPQEVKSKLPVCSIEGLSGTLNIEIIPTKPAQTIYHAVYTVSKNKPEYEINLSVI